MKRYTLTEALSRMARFMTDITADIHIELERL